MIRSAPPHRGAASRLGLAAAVLTLAAAGPAAVHAAPDLTGVWVAADSFMDKQDGTSPVAPGRAGSGAGTPRPVMPRLKGDYAARFAAARAAEARGTPTVDRTDNCIPPGMPQFWVGPFAFEFMQTAKQVNIFQEGWEQTRRIYLDGRKHPSLDDADPLYEGHSIGHWEGDTLVVDTINFIPDTPMFGSGSGHSDQMHIAERIRPAGPGLIEVQMTVEDPQALEEPWVTTRKLRRKPTMEIQDYVCAENNRNTTDANGVTQVILKPK